jgi:5-methylthioadenosine/S-adenosylhomocysteine deaminase
MEDRRAAAQGRGTPHRRNRVELVIRGASIDGTQRDIGIDGGRIAWVREPDGGAGTEPPVRRTIDGRGLHAFPGLRNGHTHAAMTLFRGYGDDLPLMEWLRTRIWPAEARLTEEDVYHGTRLALVEMIRSGTTYFNDMYWHQPGVVRAVEELGLRAHVGSVFIDHGDPSGVEAGAQREAVLGQVAERHTLAPRIQVALAPHAIYSVAPESLVWMAERAAEHDLIVHIHLSETRDEVDACVEKHGLRPAFFLQRLGLLGPNLVVAHGVYLDPEEMDLLAEHGATVVTNPTANMKLATGGIFDFRTARAAGLRVVLGTDGPGSNNNLDMIEEMKMLALVQKHRAADPTVLTAHDALAMATTMPAEAFRLGSGRLEAGALADLILVDLSHPSTQPVHDPVSALVYAANGRAVHTTVCDGKVLMHDGRLEVVDEEEVVAGAVAVAQGLASGR